jgi:uncharacterized protein (DUF433 family)
MKGTRIMVSVVLDNLASCASINEVVRLYPTLKHQDIIAAIAYAAELARGHVVMRFKTQEI